MLYPVLSSLLGGWAAWSLAHYVTHRWWHGLIPHYQESCEAHFYVEGEFKHHLIYDHDPHDPTLDEQRRFISFPRGLATKGVCLATGGYGALCLLGGGEWLLATGLFFAACYGSMRLDDWVHRRYQHEPPRQGRAARWLRGYHHVHHEVHFCNYAFFTGIPWDVVFGSYRRVKASSTHRHYGHRSSEHERNRPDSPQAQAQN